MFKGFTDYVTCMLGGECPADKNETDNVTIENESEETVVEEVDSQSSTPRMFTFFTNEEKTVEEEKEEEKTVEEEKEEEKTVEEEDEKTVEEEDEKTVEEEDEKSVEE